VVDDRQYHGLVRRDVYSVLPQRVGRVLDFGGGYGLTAAALKEERSAKSAVVVDLYADRAKVHPAVDAFEQGDAGDPAFIASLRERYGVFDTILCLDVLEHLADPWRAVAALTTLLSEDGAMVASIPNVSHMSVMGPLVFKGEWKLVDAGILDRTHLRFFVRATAIELMTSSGLKLEAVDAGYQWSWRGWKFVRRCLFGFGDRFFAAQYLIRVGRKGP